MKYLFLDIETSNKFLTESKICLLSEKITDGEFNEVSKKEILINPLVDFDEYVLKYLPHDKNDFDEAKTFAQTYDELKNDLENEDTIIISRNGYNDIKILKDECTSLNLVPFTFKFYDFNEIFLASKKVVNDIVLTDKFSRDSLKNVEIMVDTMKDICNKLNKNIEDLLNSAVNSEGYFQDGYISFRRTKDVINKEKNILNSNLNKNSNYKVFLRLLENLTTTTDTEKVLENKNISISTSYETENFTQMVNLVIWLKEAGANYVQDMKDCDIFVQHDSFINGKIKNCNRLNKINQLKTEGKNIEIISLEDLLSKIGKTKEELDIAHLPNLDFIYGENSKQAKPIKKYKKIKKNFGKI